MFEHLKGWFLERRRRKKLRLRDNEEGGEGDKVKVDGIFERARITALSAALAGTGAAWITTPIDVVKTRIMLAAGEEAKNRDSNANSLHNHATSRTTPGTTSRQTALFLTKQILKTEGIQGMFRGALLRSLWTAFGSGLYLGCYEGGRHYLEDRRRDRDEGGDVVMERERDWKGVKVGIGKSRSQGDVVRKSAWQD
ncbi:hypothetical protein GJ744_001391 [Endocarpon pusillum]|uniref:Mitochondrial carrier protein n=1 Tax=Endocarpon pusillum TaxID=364733 RepID=A0A8H7EA90_9EURO|nr:hypothetical protein GJ744_001391 [Endocarpon pusillum]